MQHNPCDWLDKPPAWNLRGGQSATVDVVMRPGVLLHFRVNDTDKHISKAKNDKKGRPYELAVWTKRRSMQHLVLGAEDENGDNYTAVVPPGVDIEYSVGASDVVLAARDGREVARNGTLNRNVHKTKDKDEVIELDSRARK